MVVILGSEELKFHEMFLPAAYWHGQVMGSIQGEMEWKFDIYVQYENNLTKIECKCHDVLPSFCIGK